MTDKESSIDRWISYVISMNPTAIRPAPSERAFEVQCTSNKMAMDVSKRFEDLGLESEYFLRVVGGDRRLFTPSLILENRRSDESTRAMINTMTATDMATMIQSICQSEPLTQYLRRAFDLVKGTMYVYRADNDLTLDALVPDITEDRLNKPVKELLGTSIDALNPIMASRRRPAIKEAIQAGNAVRTYDYIWESRKWDFIETYDYFPGSDGGAGHVVLTVQDPDTPRGWEQRSHFHRMIEDGLAVPTPRILF